MKSNLQKSTQKLLASLIGVFCFFSGSCCEKNEQARSIYGLTPVAERTAETERLCNSLPLPPDSGFLQSRITSKRESGVVTNIYSTEVSCREIGLFFREQLLRQNWKMIQFDETHPLPSFLEIKYKFKSESNEIGIWCNDIRDYCGTKRLYVSCSWD